jgi:hypothetical protein
MLRRGELAEGAGVAELATVVGGVEARGAIGCALKG